MSSRAVLASAALAAGIGAWSMALETAPADASADRAPAVHGRVLSAAGEPVAKALVVAVADDREIPDRRSHADDNGQFSFSDLPPGRYVLIAIHGHHSPGHSDPVVVGRLGITFPLRVTMGELPLDA